MQENLRRNRTLFWRTRVAFRSIHELYQSDALGSDCDPYRRPCTRVSFPLLLQTRLLSRSPPTTKGSSDGADLTVAPFSNLALPMHRRRERELFLFRVALVLDLFEHPPI